MQSIENLLPHRPPFLFVDELLECTAETITGIKTFDERDEWLKGDAGYVPDTILLESMVQCGGAGVRVLGIAEGTFGLVGIEKAEFYEGVKFGEQIQYVIQNIRISEKLIRQSGFAYVNNIPVLHARWNTMKLQ